MVEALVEGRWGCVIGTESESVGGGEEWWIAVDLGREELVATGGEWAGLDVTAGREKELTVAVARCGVCGAKGVSEDLEESEDVKEEEDVRRRRLATFRLVAAGGMSNPLCAASSGAYGFTVNSKSRPFPTLICQLPNSSLASRPGRMRPTFLGCLRGWYEKPVVDELCNASAAWSGSGMTSR